MKLRFPIDQRLTSLAGNKTTDDLANEFKLLRAGLVARGVKDNALGALDEELARALRWATVTPAIATSLSKAADAIDPTTIGGRGAGSTFDQATMALIGTFPANGDYRAERNADGDLVITAADESSIGANGEPGRRVVLTLNGAHHIAEDVEGQLKIYSIGEDDKPGVVERGGSTQDGRSASRAASTVAKGLAAINARNRAFHGGGDR
jgi:hypothetical protein